MKKRAIVKTLFFVLLTWAIQAHIIQRLECPNKSASEYIILLPSNFFLYFESCPGPLKDPGQYLKRRN